MKKYVTEFNSMDDVLTHAIEQWNCVVEANGDKYTDYLPAVEWASCCAFCHYLNDSDDSCSFKCPINNICDTLYMEYHAALTEYRWADDYDSYSFSTLAKRQLLRDTLIEKAKRFLFALEETTIK